MTAFLKHDNKLATFLSAAHLESEEDTTRLVLADYLEERGDPRSEMIRASVPLAHHHPGEAEWHDLTEQMESWQKEHHFQWLGLLPLGSYHFHRGLLHLGVDGIQLVSSELGAGIRSAIEQGWVEKLTVDYCHQGTISKAVELNRFTPVPQLEFKNGAVNASEIEKLVSANGDLHSIDLFRMVGITAEMMELFARCNHLRSFRVQADHSCSLSDLRPLAESGRIMELVWKQRQEWSHRDIETSTAFTSLKQLSIHDNPQYEFPVVFQEGVWPELEGLELHLWGERSGEQFRSLKNLPKLKSLRLTTTVSGPAYRGMDGLAQLCGLKFLELSNCDARMDFRNLESRETLTELVMKWCFWTDDAWDSLSGCAQLRRLAIAGKQFRTRDLEQIAAVTTLQSLNLSDCFYEKSANWKVLATLPELRRLILARSQVPAESLQSLAELPHLRELDLRWCPTINREQVQHLRTQLPLCRIHYKMPSHD